MSLKHGGNIGLSGRWSREKKCPRGISKVFPNITDFLRSFTKNNKPFITIVLIHNVFSKKKYPAYVLPYY